MDETESAVRFMDPSHRDEEIGFENSLLHDPATDPGGQLGGRVVAAFHRFERLTTVRQAVRVFLVESRYFGVEVPGDVVEPLAAGLQLFLGVACLELFEPLAAQVLETDDQIRHLDPGVVDVVLHLDRAPETA